MQRRAVFLDRDGVINRAIVREGKPYPPANLEELEILPGVKEACEKLHAAGFLLIVVTNQPDVARGSTTKEAVEEINQSLRSRLPLDDFYTCFHDTKDSCTCRKPLPGSLLAAAEKYNLDLSNSYMVGDRWRDVEAGQAAGCKTIFIDYTYDEAQPESVSFKVSSLLEASHIILGEMKNEKS
jgi:D-glycero-D-manno-heptose 1,7-bisphosphate phosphatase